jgi:hypothetical protein
LSLEKSNNLYQNIASYHIHLWQCSEEKIWDKYGTCPQLILIPGVSNIWFYSYSVLFKPQFLVYLIFFSEESSLTRYVQYNLYVECKNNRMFQEEFAIFQVQVPYANYIEITRNTYMRNRKHTAIMMRGNLENKSCYMLIDYCINTKIRRNL